MKNINSLEINYDDLLRTLSTCIIFIPLAILVLAGRIENNLGRMEFGVAFLVAFYWD